MFQTKIRIPFSKSKEFQAFAPFSGTCRNWFVSMVNAIPGQKKTGPEFLIWLLFSQAVNQQVFPCKYNGNQPLCTIPSGK